MKTMGDVVADSIDDNSRQESNHHASVSKELGQRTLRSLKRGLGRLWRRHRGNASITEYDPSYKVAYLGNVLTGWAKGEGCVEKPVSTLWRNYVSSNRPDVTMRLTVTNGGLTATTKDHGLTEYWAHRVTYCTAPVSHPRLFVWVYRHEGRRLRPELRCHAALCSKESTARRLASTLNTRLHQALIEFRRDKVSRQNARLSLANAVYENPSLPRRKILLSTGGQNYKPPLERSKSAPKLSAIEEDSVAEEIEQKRLLEELRSLENVARSWQDQDGWRLARLVDALNRAGASSEYSDENGSISSGCETASTSNSEERAPCTDDNNHTIVNIENNKNTNRRRVLFSDDVLRKNNNDTLPRRNSDGSPHYLNFNNNTRFSCSRKIDRNRYLLSKNDNLLEENEDEEEEEEITEEEVEEEEEEVEEINEEEMESSNVFDFEDTEVFDEIVDYRPHGESPSRLENITGRHLDVKDEKNYLTIMNQVDEMLESVDSFVTLDSLDEEEADSDESGYVEAPPKVILDQNDNDVNTKLNGTNKDHDKIHIKINQESPTKKIQDDHNDNNNHDDDDDVKIAPTDNNSNKYIKDDDNQLILKDREKVDFIKCPISETIKKLANASLRNSKTFDISTNECLKALNTFKNNKKFDENNINNDERNDESPSLHQRKQLLAQHGVTV